MTRVTRGNGIVGVLQSIPLRRVGAVARYETDIVADGKREDDARCLDRRGHNCRLAEPAPSDLCHLERPRVGQTRIDDVRRHQGFESGELAALEQLQQRAVLFERCRCPDIDG